MKTAEWSSCGRKFLAGFGILAFSLVSRTEVTCAAQDSVARAVESSSTTSSVPQTAPLVQVEFSNARLQPPHWKLAFDATGSGTFDAEGLTAEAQDSHEILAGDIHRQVQLSAAFAARAFATAKGRKFFDFPCESHAKVAFQGKKRLSYSGPDGKGSCEFNYAKEKDIQSLSDALMAVESTLLSGARLEKLLQHDRLGLDQELDNLVNAVHDGSAVELGAIREILTRIATDDQVLERARKKARLLLAQAAG